MPLPVILCGMECGLFTGSGTFGQGHFLSGSGAPSFDTTTFRSGLRSIRCNAAGATVHVAIAFAAAAQTRVIGRFYIRFATLPSGACAIVQLPGGGPGIRYAAAAGEIRTAVSGNTGSPGVAVTTGIWYRIDFDFTIDTAGDDTAACMVDGVACASITGAGAAAGQTQLEMGVLNAVTADLYLDDLTVSLTAADYPLGPEKIVGYVPNADGTHTATTTTIVRGTLAAPTGGGNVAGSTDTNAWVNGRPLLGGASDNTRLVNQQTAGATLYAEVDFESSAESNAPQAVEVITADRQAGTATGNFQTKLNDNGTENAIANRGTVAGVTSDRYVNKMYATMPADSAAWTLARFNALKARFGYSSDATPDQYWRGIMIEAGYPLALPPGFGPIPHMRFDQQAAAQTLGW